MNTDSVIENIDQNVQSIGETAGIQPSDITADPANTDFFVENIDNNVKAIAETLDVTPFEVTADPANTDFFIENIAKNVDLIKDNFDGGGGGGEDVINPTRLILGGQSGEVEIKPVVTVDITHSLTSLESMFSGDTAVTSVKFDDSIDLSNVTTARYVFLRSSNVNSIEFNNSMTNVTTYEAGFQGCSLLTDIELPSDMSKVTNANLMFSACSSLRSINIPSNFQPTSCRGMFNECRSLDETPYVDTSKSTNVAIMFAYFYGKPVNYVYNWSSITNTSGIQGVFSYYDSSENATQSSINNILRSMLTATGISGNKTFFNIFQLTPASDSHLYNLIVNSPYYQDVIDAGWTALS